MRNSCEKELTSQHVDWQQYFSWHIQHMPSIILIGRISRWLDLSHCHVSDAQITHLSSVFTQHDEMDHKTDLWLGLVCGGDVFCNNHFFVIQPNLNQFKIEKEIEHACYKSFHVIYYKNVNNDICNKQNNRQQFAVIQTASWHSGPLNAVTFLVDPCYPRRYPYLLGGADRSIAGHLAAARAVAVPPHMVHVISRAGQARHEHRLVDGHLQHLRLARRRSRLLVPVTVPLIQHVLKWKKANLIRSLFLTLYLSLQIITVASSLILTFHIPICYNNDLYLSFISIWIYLQLNLMPNFLE